MEMEEHLEHPVEVAVAAVVAPTTTASVLTMAAPQPESSHSPKRSRIPLIRRMPKKICPDMMANRRENTGGKW